MTILSFLGEIAIYGWVLVTLLIGLFVEVVLVWVTFSAWRVELWDDAETSTTEEED